MGTGGRNDDFHSRDQHARAHQQHGIHSPGRHRQVVDLVVGTGVDFREGVFEGGQARSLHHMEDVNAAAERAALLLAPGGVVVVDEFCAERIDRATAS